MSDFTHSPDLVVIGDTNLDLMLQVEHFPGPDDEVEAVATLSSAGGNAANIAVQAARLGLHAALISAIGDDEQGKSVIKAMQDRGVDLSALRIIAGKATGLVVAIVRADGQRAMIASRGANTAIGFDETGKAMLEAARIVHVSDPTPEVVASLPALIDSKPAALSLDPGSIGARKGVPTLRPLLQICRYLFVNQNELAALTGQDDPEQAVNVLFSLGIQTVFVKRGARGCRIYAQTLTLSIPAFPVQSVDATGAGDAFDAAMLYAILREMPLEEAGRFANAVGAMATLELGAQSSQPDLAQVNDFLTGK